MTAGAQRDITISPTFVLGSAHSGTTILYKMIALHPEMSWFSQFSLRSGEISGRWSLPLSRTTERALRRLARHDWRKVDPSRWAWVVPQPGEVRTIWDSLLERGGTIEERAESVRACIEAFCLDSRHRFFVAKRPSFYRHIPVLRYAFPSARFVHIVRDGRPVALSVRHKFARVHGPEASLALAAEYWVEEIRAVRSAAETIDLLEIRYEDLCVDVHDTLAKVLTHSMVPAVSRFVDRLPRRLSSTNEHWTDSASPDELARICAAQAELLGDYGYQY